MIALPSEVFARAIDITSIEKQVIEQQGQQLTRLKEWETKYSLSQDDDGNWMKGMALVVVEPKQVRQSTLTAYHDAPTAGHPGIWKTQTMLGRDYWWPTM
jgi:hypothetical protein